MEYSASRWRDKTTFFGGLVAVAEVLGPEYAQLLLRVIGKPRGKNPQHNRRITLALAKLNQWIISLGVWADDPIPQLPPSTGRPAFGLDPGPKNDLRDFEHAGFAAQAWLVGEHPDIALARREEAYFCDRIATRLGLIANTESRRIEGLNLLHDARLESLTGKTAEADPDDGDGHAASDRTDQIVAEDMTFELVGFYIHKRRDRDNELLEDMEKLLTKGARKGKTYRPNKAAGPGRALTGQARAMALADLVPCVAPDGRHRTKIGAKPYPRGDEPCLFDKCRRAGRKELQDYAAYDHDDTVKYRQWDLLGKPASAGFADRHRHKPLINVPETWSRNSYADELMTYSAKARLKDPGWGVIPFVRIDYHPRSLNNPFWD
jgi:hypothetical protein